MTKHPSTIALIGAICALALATAATPASATAAFLSRTGSGNNLHGLFADGTNGIVNVNMAESAAVDNQGNGIGAFSPSGSSVTVEVTTSQVTGNFTNGIDSLGLGTGSVAVEIGNSQITGNVNGLNHSGSGQIVTLGGNQLRRNLSDGTFTGSAATQ